MSPKLTIAVPVYNESDSLVRFHEQLTWVIKKLQHHFRLKLTVLYIDDGSTDQSCSIIKSLPSVGFDLQLVCFSRNFGKEAALRLGLDRAGDGAIVFLDSDGQHPPELLFDFVGKWLNEDYDVVYARHVQRTDGIVKQKMVGAFYRLVNAGSRFDIPANAADFKLLSPRATKALLSCPERIRFFKGLTNWIGFKQCAIDYEPDERIAGETKWSFWNLLVFSLEGITSFSIVPLRVTILLGMMIAIPAALYGFWIVVKTLVAGVDIPGYASLITAVTFLGGLQIILLGVMGEYIGTILREVKSRPSYIVADSYVADSSANASAPETPKVIKVDNVANCG